MSNSPRLVSSQHAYISSFMKVNLNSQTVEALLYPYFFFYKVIKWFPYPFIHTYSIFYVILSIDMLYNVPYIQSKFLL